MSPSALVFLRAFHCHAGIKARGSGNEKREEKPRLTDSLLASTPAFC